MFKLLIWFGVFVIGVGLGFFIKPRTVAITGSGIMAAVVVSMIAAYFLSNNAATEHAMVFGVAMLLMPIVIVVVYMGASFGEKIKNKRR